MKSGIIYGKAYDSAFDGIEYKLVWETTPAENGGNYSIVDFKFYLTCPKPKYYTSYESRFEAYFARLSNVMGTTIYNHVNDTVFNADFNITPWFDDGKYSVYKKFQFDNKVYVRGENIVGVEQFVGEFKYTQYHDFGGLYSYPEKFYLKTESSDASKSNGVNDFGGCFDLSSVEFEPINRGIKITTAPNFNDEDNPTITYINDKDKVTSIQAGISLDGETLIIPYREMALDGNTYTFNLTDAERQALRDNTADKNILPVYYMMKTKRTYNKVVYEWVTKLERTLTIIDCMPQLNPTVEDVSETTLFLTGDKNVFVRYHSNAKYTINATASKGAKINYQQISNGSQRSTTASGILYGVETEKFLFTATDTRDNITSLLVEKPFIPYIKLTCNVKLLSATPDGVIKFRVSGNYFNGSFGKENNFLSVKYRFKEESGNYGDWVTVNPTVTSNTYSIDITISNLDYLKTYIFDVEARDYLNIVTNSNNEFKFLPVFDWSKTDFNFNVPITYTDTNSKTTYSISDAAKQLLDADISTNMLIKMNSVVKALTSRQNAEVEVYKGANYSDVFVSMQLIGNTLTGYVDAHRNANAGTGDINNEIVCTVEFDIDKKVTGFNSTCFPSATIGALASFAIEDCMVYTNDGSVDESMVGKGSFNIKLTATDIANSRYNGFFSMPCMLDLTKF